MSDILEVLGRAERDAQEIPARWLALVEGRATELELAALKREAEAGGEARLLWERFRPLDCDRELAARAVAHVRAEKVRSRSALAGAAAILAVAAAACLAWLALPASLPRYQLEAAAAEVSHRSEAASAASVPEYHRDSALSLILRPVRRVDGLVAADAYLVRDGAAEPWTPPLQISPTGAVRLDGTIAELLPNVSGEVTLLFVLRPTRARALSPAAALDAWKRGDQPILAQPIRVRAE